MPRLIVSVVAGRVVMHLAEIVFLLISSVFLLLLLPRHVLISHLVVLLTIHRILLVRGEFVVFHTL